MLDVEKPRAADEVQRVTMAVDIDGDGVADMLVTGVDLDGDGIVDILQVTTLIHSFVSQHSFTALTALTALTTTIRSVCFECDGAL